MLHNVSQGRAVESSGNGNTKNEARGDRIDSQSSYGHSGLTQCSDWLVRQQDCATEASVQTQRLPRVPGYSQLRPVVL